MYKVNVDACQEAARMFGVSKLPTTIVREASGSTVASIMGAQVDQIRSAITSVAGSSSFGQRSSSARAQGGNTAGSGRSELSPAEAARAAALARFGAAPAASSASAPSASSSSVPSAAEAAAAAEEEGEGEGDGGAGGDSEVATFLVSQLASMGFAEAHARQAVRALGDGASVDSAVDWMLAHLAEEEVEEKGTEKEAEPMETGDDEVAAEEAEEAEAPPAGPHTHQALCDVCTERIVGVRYRCDQCSDYDLCETHFRNQDHAKGMHTFTGHKTEFVPQDKAPLTPEELAEKKQKLKERLERVRKEREAQEAQEKHAAELARIKNARESAAIRERLKEQAAEREAAKLRREKELEAKHRAKVKANIAKDKAERRAAAEARKRERDGVARPDAAAAPAAAAAKPATGSTIANATEATVQIRLKSGSRLVGHFSPDDTVATVAAWARAEAGLAVSPNLGTSFPRKTFTEAEAASITLREADLVPRGALVEF